MKIVCLSDTHCRLREIDVPEGDLLLHAGDLTFQGNHKEIGQELRKLGRIAKNFKNGCVFIAGNHDWMGEKNPYLLKQMAEDEGLIYLDHSSVQVEGFNIFGSPYQPEFCNWAFNLPRGEPLKKKWAQIPDDTDILITHGPPIGILDPVESYNTQKCEFDIQHVGCADLYNRIQELKQLKLHVFGHLHAGYGILKVGDLTYVNAANCTEQYKPTNKPIITDL